MVMVTAVWSCCCVGPPGTPRSHCGDGDRRVVLLLCLGPPGTPRIHCGDCDRRVVLLLFAVICVPHVHAVVFSRAQKRTDWVCWEDLCVCVLKSHSGP